MTFGRVQEHKYLGINTYGTQFKTRKNWEHQTINVANKYMWACKKISIDGPDIIQLGITAWKAAAIPSILFGSETLITTEKKQYQN